MFRSRIMVCLHAPQTFNGLLNVVLKTLPKLNLCVDGRFHHFFCRYQRVSLHHLPSDKFTANGLVRRYGENRNVCSTVFIGTKRQIRKQQSVCYVEKQHDKILNQASSCQLNSTLTHLLKPGILQAGFHTSGLQASDVKLPVEGIQKAISTLSMKRAVRKRKLKTSQSTQPEFQVFAYATSEEYPLEDITENFNQQGLYEVSPLADDEDDAIRAVAKYSLGEEQREIYLFREGAAVFWNFTESEAGAVLRFLRQHEVNSYDINLVNMEFEEMTYRYSNDRTRLEKGDIVLKSLPSEPSAEDLEKSTHERFAFSNALALSVKLSIWEAFLNKYVEDIEWVTEDLRVGRMVRITRREVSRKTGELFTLRHLINLSSDLLDTPDFYWDREHLEAIYLKTYAHFNISKRTKVMNEKLSHCCELTELLTTTLNDAHHVRLEWMIIILILVEVVFEFMHYLESDVGRYTTQRNAAQYEFQRS